MPKESFWLMSRVKQARPLSFVIWGSSCLTTSLKSIVCRISWRIAYLNIRKRWMIFIFCSVCLQEHKWRRRKTLWFWIFAQRRYRIVRTSGRKSRVSADRNQWKTSLKAVLEWCGNTKRYIVWESYLSGIEWWKKYQAWFRIWKRCRKWADRTKEAANF